MKRTLIRYRTKPDRTDENEALIKGVFGNCTPSRPQGMRYMSLKLGRRQLRPYRRKRSRSERTRSPNCRHSRLSRAASGSAASSRRNRPR